MFPPIVPMLRRWGVATCAAACHSPRYAARSFSCRTSSVSVTPAPIVRPVPLANCLSSATRRRPTSVDGTCCRRFMFGSRSVPPATSIVSPGFEASSSAASPTVRGAWNVNSGSLIMTG